VLNNDDDFSKYLETVTPYEILTYGIDNEAQFMAQNIKESLQGAQFDFTYGDETWYVPNGVAKSNCAPCKDSLIF
jgi:UDP-N-acetylmuramoyl-L-alanyl-D-glutamate-L-lysine ligase